MQARRRRGLLPALSWFHPKYFALSFKPGMGLAVIFQSLVWVPNFIYIAEWLNLFFEEHCVFLIILPVDSYSWVPSSTNGFLLAMPIVGQLHH